MKILFKILFIVIAFYIIGCKYTNDDITAENSTDNLINHKTNSNNNALNIGSIKDSVMKTNTAYGKSVILPLDSVRNILGVMKDMSTAELNLMEFNNLEKMISQEISNYNVKQKKDSQINELESDIDDYIDISNYKRQYVLGKNEKSEKIIWINMFCDDQQIDWLHNLIIVKSLSNCYFNMHFDLTNKKLLLFSLN